MKVFFLFLVVMGTLALFNPEMDEFSSHMNDRTQTEASDNARFSSGGLLNGAISTVSTLARAAANDQFERSSYVICSTFTYDTNGGARGGEWTYFGVAGQFFEIERPSTTDS